MKKRKDGRYAKNVLIAQLPTGERKYKTVYGKTKKEVEQRETELLENLKNNQTLINDSISLNYWAEQWLNLYKKPNVEHNTYAMYENALNHHILPVLGNIQITELSTLQIQLFLNGLIQAEKIRTAEICKLTIEQIIKQAICNRIIDFDVCKGLQTIKKSTKEKRPLSDFEKYCIKIAPLDLRQKIFIDIMRFLGLRRGEVLALTKADIDLNKMQLSVNKNLGFVKNDFEIKSPKTKNSIRIIPIPYIIKNELETYIKSLDNDILFTAKNGDYMTKSSYRKFWDKIMRIINNTADENKIDNKYVDCNISFTPHICRHTYATDLYYSGIDIKTAQYLLGHFASTMTLDIYTHLDRTHIDKSVDTFNDYLQKSQN